MLAYSQGRLRHTDLEARHALDLRGEPELYLRAFGRAFGHTKERLGIEPELYQRAPGHAMRNESDLYLRAPGHALRSEPDLYQ